MFSTQSDWFLCGLLEADAECAVIRVDREPFVIGRRPGLSLTLESQFISGRHAELSTLGERLFVTDLGSRNGTLVNAQRVRRVQLGVGDLLSVGDVEFRVDRKPRSDGRPSAGSGRDLDAMHLHWLKSQFAQLLHEQAVAAVLRPVVHLPDETVVAYESTAQSRVAGLETEFKMCDTARILGREKELNQLLLQACGSAARHVAKGSWLFLQTPAAANLESEVVPVLKSLRQSLPGGRIVVEVEDAPARSLRSLNDFVVALQTLDMHLGLGAFAWEHLRFLQSARVRPISVRLDAGLTQNLAQKSDLERRRIKSMVELLHHYEIQVVACEVATPEDAETCRELSVDLADGPLFGDPLPLPSQRLPDTCILSPANVDSLLDSIAEQTGAPSAPLSAAPGEATSAAHVSGRSRPAHVEEGDDVTADLPLTAAFASFRLPPSDASR
jgi:EAL domain-containing protein (putative c-di-GMP-specific phosphodiesterase class I)